MKRILSLTAVSFGLVLTMVATSSKAQQIISYQGLAQSNGATLSGSHSIAIAIYADSTGGSAMYSETQTGVIFTNGLFNIEIGTNPANPLPVFDAGSYNGTTRPAPHYFLGVSIDGGQELTPRSKLGTSPTSWSSRFADSTRIAALAITVPNNSITAAKMSDGDTTPGLVLTANGGTPSWQASSGVPSGAILAFGDSGARPGYTFTGISATQNGGNSWTTGAVLPIEQWGTTGTVVGGKIYVIGGENDSQNYNQIYDPMTDTWSAGAALPVGQSFMTGAVVNGKIYVIGGQNDSGNNNQIYDPVANTWSTGAALPIAEENMTSAVVGGKIYVIGGGNPTQPNNPNHIYVYDPVANTWRTGTNLPVAQAFTTSAVVGGKIYVIGGDGGTQDNQIYDPVANTWKTGTQMPVGQAYMTSAVVNGKIYVIGGSAGNLNNTQIYDPVSNTWTMGAVLPFGQAEMTSAVVNGKIYVLGGSSNISVYNNQIYTPGLNLYFFTKN